MSLSLNELLAQASNEDLDPLVNYIKNATMSEWLTIDDRYKKWAPDHHKYSDLIAKEIRCFGGNTFANMFRGGEGPEYKEVVCDVADKLKVNFNSDQSIETIESAILSKIMTEAYAKMDDQQKREFLQQVGMDNKSGIPAAIPAMVLQGVIRASGFAAYQIAVIVANAIAKFVLGRGLTLATNAAITRSVAVFAGPVGWAITGIWTAIDLAGPAFRVTIPCVVQVAMLRIKQMCEQTQQDASANEESTVKALTGPLAIGNASSSTRSLGWDRNSSYSSDVELIETVDATEQAVVVAQPVSNKDYTQYVFTLIAGLGGFSNIDSCFNCATRMRFTVFNGSKVDDAVLLSCGAYDVVHLSDTEIQVVVGNDAQKIADAYRKLRG